MPHRSDHRERRRLRMQAAGVGFSESDFLELCYGLIQVSCEDSTQVAGFRIWAWGFGV